MGKVFPASFIGFEIIVIRADIFMLLVDEFTSGKLNYLHFPNWVMAISLLLLAPLACILSIGYNVLVSSRSNDTRAARQVGALIILPFGAVYVLSGR